MAEKRKMTPKELDEFLKDHWISELEPEDWKRVPHLFDEYDGEDMDEVTEEEYKEALSIFELTSEGDGYEKE